MLFLNRHAINQRLILFLAAFLLAFTAGCATTQSSKIPVTGESKTFFIHENSVKNFKIKYTAVDSGTAVEIEPLLEEAVKRAGRWGEISVSTELIIMPSHEALEEAVADVVDYDEDQHHDDDLDDVARCIA